MNIDMEAGRILAQWQTQSVPDLVDTAFRLGTLISAKKLNYDDAVKGIEWKLETCFDYESNVTPLWSIHPLAAALWMK